MIRLLRQAKVQMAIFLFVIFITAFLNYKSPQYIVTFLIGLASTVLVDLLLLKIRKVKPFFPSAGIVTGSIIGLVASPNLLWYQIILIGAIAMFSKHFIKIKNKHIFNPAAFGLFFLHLGFGQDVSWWAATWQSSAFDYLILALPAYVSMYKMRRYFTVVSFMVLYGIMTRTLIDPTAIFFALVMLPEPMTTPVKLSRQILFGIFVAAVSFLIVFNVPDVLILALLLGNLAFFKFK